MEFGLWMMKLDTLFRTKYGCSIYDVEDMLHRDWYDSGISPERALKRAEKQLKESYML